MYKTGLVLSLFLSFPNAYEYVCGQPVAGKYGKGDKVPVCLHFSTDQKVLFEPRLDVYSAIQAEGAFQYFLPKLFTDTGGETVPNGTNQTESGQNQTDSGGNRTEVAIAGQVLIAAQAQGTNLTVWLPYLTELLVAKVFSVVVYVSDGKPDSVEWDNSCSMCSDDCLHSYEDPSEEVCADTHCAVGNYTDCDPRLYVSFMGKDKDGLNLDSGGYRISRFRKYSLYDTYSEAKQNF